MFALVKMQTLKVFLLTVLLCGAVLSQDEAGSPETTGEADAAAPEIPENTDVAEEPADPPPEPAQEPVPEEIQPPGT